MREKSTAIQIRSRLPATGEGVSGKLRLANDKRRKRKNNPTPVPRLALTKFTQKFISLNMGTLKGKGEGKQNEGMLAGHQTPLKSQQMGHRNGGGGPKSTRLVVKNVNPLRNGVI